MGNLSDIYKVEEYIKQNADKSLTTAMLCEALGIERKVMTEHFEHYIGLSPDEYLERARMQQGEQLASMPGGTLPAPFDTLTMAERIIAFYPAPGHREYSGHELYQEYREIYDNLIQKGYFGKDLGYVIEAKQITEKLANDCYHTILELAKSNLSLEDACQRMLGNGDTPRKLFYMFLYEMVENGTLENAQWSDIVKKMTNVR